MECLDVLGKLRKYGRKGRAFRLSSWRGLTLGRFSLACSKKNKANFYGLANVGQEPADYHELSSGFIALEESFWHWGQFSSMR